MVCLVVVIFGVVKGLVTFWVVVVDGWLDGLGVVVLWVGGGCVGWVVVCGFVSG